MSAQLRDQQPQPIKILAHTINPQYANNNFQYPTTELTKSTFDKSSHVDLIEKWSSYMYFQARYEVSLFLKLSQSF